jgi:hypothetical protein
MDNCMEAHLQPEELHVFRELNSPMEIQAYLDTCTYRPEYSNLCPVSVLKTRTAHCLDGAIFAAAALRRLGHPPRLVDIFPDPGRDDDHVLAIFRRHGRWGAVAKSNFVGLRYREPVYHSLRELVMSYFEGFYNIYGERSLRSYTRPLNLAGLDRYEWQCRDTGADEIERRLLGLTRRPLFTPEMTASFSKVDDLTYRAGMLVVNEAGIFRPKEEDPQG